MKKKRRMKKKKRRMNSTFQSNNSRRDVHGLKSGCQETHCDRHPPKTNRFKKTQRNIMRVDVQYPQEKENYINWPKFKKYLKSKLNNEEMQIEIWLVDEGDLIKIPKNLE